MTRLMEPVTSESLSPGEAIQIQLKLDQATTKMLNIQIIRKMIAFNFIVTAFSFLLGWAIYSKLQKVQYPSSAARFGCFWFLFVATILNLVLLPFTAHIHIAVLIYVITVVAFLIILLLVYQKKKK